MVLGKPFLFWLVKHLKSCGFKEFIFSIGYKADFIEKFPWKTEFPAESFLFLKEVEPLGTGGAVQAVFKKYKNLEKAWIVNGDTLLENPIAPETKITDDAFYLALKAENVFDAKPNLVTEGSRVIEVKEGGTTFDGGHVFVSRSAVEKYLGDVPFSFHKLIEKSFKENKVGYEIVAGTCFDIGTPERLSRFEKYIDTKSY
jgi:NDP-sugar pyrophosphorylase family protein